MLVISVTRLTVTRDNDSASQVFDVPGLHVGNLKLINGRLKFEAIGYDQTGAVIPGGGRLTDWRNARFATPDAAVISSGLARG